ncbi:MAG TPA: lipocalin family protein [Phycisphaerae bacterium]|nr:lipocalin family protein [Phycisphaerae bacterium]
MMFRCVPAFLTVVLTIPLCGCGFIGADNQPPLDTVARVEVDRYTGKWYEIAHYPNWFQASCASSTAEYTANADGTIEVFNTCLAADGSEVSTIRGTARVVDPATNAKLTVSFPFIPFPGDYWIIQLGDDYEYAVVGEPRRSTLFILSRTPTLDADTLDGILTRLTEQGYDPERLVYDTPVMVP